MDVSPIEVISSDNVQAVRAETASRPIARWIVAIISGPHPSAPCGRNRRRSRGAPATRVVTFTVGPTYNGAEFSLRTSSPPSSLEWSMEASLLVSAIDFNARALRANLEGLTYVVA